MCVLFCLTFVVAHDIDGVALVSLVARRIYGTRARDHRPCLPHAEMECVSCFDGDGRRLHEVAVVIFGKMQSVRISIWGSISEKYFQGSI
jgi:hypothetical protein